MHPSLNATIARPAAARARLVAAASLAMLLAACALPAAAPGAGDDAAAAYRPVRGQAGKDVVWIATPERHVDRMLQIARVTADDTVIDLGAGDGKIVIAAARGFGARARGIEYNPDLVGLARRNATAAGVADRTSFRQGDIFKTDFSDASVVTMYLLPHLNLQLRQTLMAMKPGTRVVSHQWTMGNWPADETSWIRGSPVFLWIVPANAGGRWRLTFPQGTATATAEVTATQTFQRLTDVRIALDGLEHEPRDLRVIGDRWLLDFTDDTGAGRRFDGRIVGDRIRGTVTGPGGRSDTFEAVRVGPAPVIIGSQGYSEEESRKVGAELGG